MFIHAYDTAILPLIRSMFAEEEGFTEEEALIYYSDESLLNARGCAPADFKEWAEKANQWNEAHQKACEPSTP